MTVDKIIPCVCIPHPPTVADKTTYGMPILSVSGSLTAHKQFWSAKCPVCGRGGLMEETSSYKALKRWNATMEDCHHMENKPIVFYDDFEKYTDADGHTLPEFRSEWDNL